MAKGQQRDPKREAFWRGVVGRFPKSGLSVRAFCRREKVTEPSFYAWRRILRERGAERGTAHQSKPKRRPVQPAFVPVVVRGERAGDNSPVEAERGGPDITVELRGGRVLRLPAAVTGERLAELIRVVESVPGEGRP